MIREKEKVAGGNQATNQYQEDHYTNPLFAKQDTILSFEEKMYKAGLSIKEPIIADGKLHRFHVKGDKASTKNGWYILFDGSVRYGAFGSWKTGYKEKWCSKASSELSPYHRKENRRRIAVALASRREEEQSRQENARKKALEIWELSIPISGTHPYLEKKGIKCHGIRLYKTSLVIPVRDVFGTLHSLQFIGQDGCKRFLSGGRKKGCYFAIGKPTDTLCIAEGYATASSIYEATGFACAVAFDAGNLEGVAIALRNKFPNLNIILCADNDINTEGNPGVTKARKAASIIGARLAIPPCTGDFNDMHQGGYNDGF